MTLHAVDASRPNIIFKEQKKIDLFSYLPVVGSSRNKILGDNTISMAIQVRFLSPPDTPR
jgi:hypothetical protein